MSSSKQLTVGSLFSGIGGLDLGLERAGMRVIWHSEIDPYACRVLNKHWPEVVNHGNIKEINWDEIERPDVICGGYPCQPFSTAGRRQGEEDPRHLWPWVREAISRLRPRYAILENVRGHLSLGGLSVIGELASIGYDAEWRIVSAASVGANHRRDRVIIVAYPSIKSCDGSDYNSRELARPEEVSQSRDSGGAQDVANTGSIPRHGREHSSSQGEARERVALQISSSGGSGDVADSDNSGGGASRRSDHGEWAQAEQGRQIEPQPWASGRSSDVADTNGGRCEECKSQGKSLQGTSCSCQRNLADSNSERLEGQRAEQPTSRAPRGSQGESLANSNSEQLGQRGVSSDARQTHPRWVYNGGGQEGYVGWKWWQVEPDVGRVAHGIPSRVDRLRGLGNAVVPQVAEVIGRLVVAHADAMDSENEQ